jgi:hypothetical protein
LECVYLFYELIESRNTPISTISLAIRIELGENSEETRHHLWPIWFKVVTGALSSEVIQGRYDALFEGEI